MRCRSSHAVSADHAVGVHHLSKSRRRRAGAPPGISILSRSLAVRGLLHGDSPHVRRDASWAWVWLWCTSNGSAANGNANANANATNAARYFCVSNANGCASNGNGSNANGCANHGPSNDGRRIATEKEMPKVQQLRKIFCPSRGLLVACCEKHFEPKLTREKRCPRLSVAQLSAIRGKSACCAVHIRAYHPSFVESMLSQRTSDDSDGS